MEPIKLSCEQIEILEAFKYEGCKNIKQVLEHVPHGYPFIVNVVKELMEYELLSRAGRNVYSVSNIPYVLTVDERPETIQDRLVVDTTTVPEHKRKQVEDMMFEKRSDIVKATGLSRLMVGLIIDKIVTEKYRRNNHFYKKFKH